MTYSELKDSFYDKLYWWNS